MQFIKDNKNIFFLLGVAVVALGLWAFNGNGIYNSGDEDIAALITELADDQVVADNLSDEPFEEIVIVAEKPGFAEKVNEAAVANQVNAAQKLSDDTDGAPEE